MFKKLTSLLASITMAVTALTLVPVANANAAINDVCGTGGTPAVTFLSATTFGIDATPGYDAQYIGYKINSPTAVKNLWVKLDTFAGGSVTLAPNQPAQQSSGDVAANTDTFTYFLARATSVTNTAQTHRAVLYQGNPDLAGATAICSRISSFARVEDQITANANKVDNISVNVPAGTTLGGNITVTATGSTGTVGAGPAYAPGIIILTPSPKSDFPANAWRLVATQINFTSGVIATHNNVLFLSNQDQVGGGANRNYNAVYTYKAVAQAASPVTLTPIQYLASGTQIKETGSLPTGAALQPLPVVENRLTISKTSASSTVPVGGGSIQYTVTVSNGAAGAASIDDVVDTLPATTSYVAGSSLINNVAVTTEAGVLTYDSGTRRLVFNGPHTIPGNGSKTFKYSVQFPATASATYLNTAVAFVGGTTIDANLTASDTTPAAATLTQGSVPPSMNARTVYTAKGVTSSFTATASTDPAAPITSWCLVDPANSSNCATGPYTVANVGTWSINASTGAITFVPNANYTGTATIGAKATNSVGQSTAATQSVVVIPPPTVTNATLSVGQGQSGTLSPLATAAAGTNINYASACVVDPADSVCKATVTVAGVGTYVVDPTDGDVTFTADANASPGAKPALTYRIADALGQTGTATLTVTVTAPAPTITGNTATTITTTPVTVSPASVTGTGLTRCIIDPVTTTCGSTVTITGVGTYVLNGNGSVTFTAAVGYVGTTSVDYEITNGVTTAAATLTVTVNPVPPVNNPAPAPNIEPTSGSGPVNNPVTLNPTVTPAVPTPGLCLLQPDTLRCRAAVTIKGQGTWTLNANRTVTYVPVSNWFGTSRVTMRAWDGLGRIDDEPLSVTIMAPSKRPPRTITIGNFIDGSPVITPRIAASIRAFVNRFSDYKNVQCVGFTEGPTVLATDRALSLRRAVNSCNFILNTLKMNYKLVGVSSGQDTIENPQRRRVVITLTD
jgi:CshA-type fibril repeat protein